MAGRQYRRRREPRREKDSFDEVADVARSAYRIASKIKDVINIETKSYIRLQSTAVPTPTPTTSSFNYNAMTPVIINAPEQGDEDFQRIGDSIKIHHLRFAFTVLKPDALPDQQVRLIIFWDEGNQIAAASDVLYSSLLGLQAAPLSPKDWDKRHNSRILYDKHFKQSSDTWNANTAYGVDSTSKVVDLRIGLHTQFSAGTTTIVTGALKYFFVSDNSTNTSVHVVPMITYTDD